MRRLWRGTRGAPSASPHEHATRIYYASDVHGSEQCWRKFLGAARFYQADALIMGGDLTGKAIVPVERHPDGTHSARLLGDTRIASDPDSLAELLDAIRYNGMYPWVSPAEEIARYSASPELQSDLFNRVMLDGIRHWIELADARLTGRPVAGYVIAGNDDPWSVDAILASGDALTFCDERVVRLGDHELLSCSFANRTPWNSPRELDEDDLYRRLRALADQLETPASAIFNLHVPPYDSGLDTAQRLTPDLTPIFEHGAPAMAPVGSHAVRQIIEEVQPLLALHGHIHECRAAKHIGRTLVINPGSEYNTGRIHGVTVTLTTESVLSHQLVTG